MIRLMSWAGLLSALLSAWGCATDGTPAGIADALDRLEEGRTLARRNHPAEARAVFTQALRSNPDLAEAWYERGRCEVRLRLEAGTEEDPRLLEQNAMDDFSVALQKNPAYADAYFNRAMLFSSKAQYKLAVDDLLNAVRFKPRDPEAHLWLGELYEKKFVDSILLAMDHYEKYVDLGGTDTSVREKVRIWKDFKKQIPAITPEPTSRVPTAEDERKAQELHSKALDLLKNPDKAEAVKAFEELLGTYGHTKYVQSKLQALQAVVAAFKKKDAPK
ncbi:MAG TPA: tetratricopeptide repeat protein [Planctomycetota bacterium]|nr:tetratricopeptide repeat protein [Planctomycetota bacterium]